MVTNPGKYSTLGSGGTLSQILDDTDHPHTGLIKALSVGLGGNYAISGFNITKTNATQFAVASGVIFRDGAKAAISASSSPHGTALTATTNYYHILSVNSGGAFILTAPSAASKVPELPNGNIPIAIIAYKGSASDGSDMYIQYLTTTKTDNSLSIGYDSSGYTEMSKITAASGGTTIEVPTAGGDFIIDNTDADKKIVTRLGSDDANTAFEVRNNSNAAKLTVGGDGLVATAGNIKVGGNVIQASDGGNTITMDTNDNVTLAGDLAVTGQITGTSTGTTDAGLTLINTDAGGGTAPDLVFYRNSSSPADGDFTLRIDARGKNDAGSPEDINYTSIFARILDKTDGTEDGTLLIGSIVAGDTVDANNTQLMVQGSGIRVRGLTGTGTAPAGQISIETRDTTIVDDDELGRINFSAPVEGSGSDAIEVAASIKAIAKDTFTSSVNTTDLVLSTALSGAATEKLRIKSDGKVGIGTDSPDNLLEIQNSDSSTNSIVYPFKLTETTSGTATHGLGVGMKFEVENASGTQKETSYITSSLATATNGAEMGQLDLHVGKVYPGTSYAINPAITMLGKFPAYVATRETWGIAHQWGESNSIKVAGGANPAGGGTPGSLYPQKLSLLDTSVGSNTYFQLWALPTGSSPVAYSIPHGFTMTLKNIGHQTATIYSGHVQEHIDFGQTSNAFISAANTISLPAMATITIMAYGDANETHIKLHEILDGYDTNNYSGYDEGAATGEGWLVISQTG